MYASVWHFAQFLLGGGLIGWGSISIALYTAKHQRVLEARALKAEQDKAIEAAKRDQESLAAKQEALVAKAKIEAENRIERLNDNLWKRIDLIQQDVVDSRDFFKSECERLNMRIQELEEENKELSAANSALQTSYNSLLIISNRDSEKLTTLTKTIAALKDEGAKRQKMLNELRAKSAKDLHDRDLKIKEQDLKMKSMQEEINLLKSEKIVSTIRSRKPTL